MRSALLPCVAALLLFGAGCTSPSPERPTPAAGASGDAGSTEDAAAKPKGPAYLLRMIDYRSGARLELVNPAHTTAVAQYSKVRTDATRKVTSEEWMTGLIDFLKDEGWSKEEHQGSAPAVASGTLRWSLELVGPQGTSYVAAPMDAKGTQARRLLTLQAAFVDTYNATPGFQSVQAQPGKLPFKVPEWQNAPRKGGG